jgi:hypothetical protein
MAPTEKSSSSVMQKAISAPRKECPLCSILAEIYGMILFSTWLHHWCHVRQHILAEDSLRFSTDTKKSGFWHSAASPYFWCMVACMNPAQIQCKSIPFGSPALYFQVSFHLLVKICLTFLLGELAIQCLLMISALHTIRKYRLMVSLLWWNGI